MGTHPSTLSAVSILNAGTERVANYDVTIIQGELVLEPDTTTLGTGGPQPPTPTPPAGALEPGSAAVAGGGQSDATVNTGGAVASESALLASWAFTLLALAAIVWKRGARRREVREIKIR